MTCVERSFRSSELSDGPGTGGRRSTRGLVGRYGEGVRSRLRWTPRTGRRPPMRVLVAWDDSREAELLALYLNVGSSQAVIHTDLGAFRQALSEPGVWDAVLLPIDRPDEQ